MYLRGSTSRSSRVRKFTFNSSAGFFFLMIPMLELKQINLQHSKSASFELNKLLASMHTDIYLIQEPYLSDGLVSGLKTNNGSLFYKDSVNNTRACIYISYNINASLIPEVSTNDRAAVIIRIKPYTELVLASVNLPHMTRYLLHHRRIYPT